MSFTPTLYFMAERLINRDKSVIVAADVEGNQLSPLVEATHNIEGIGGYKVGLVLGLDLSLRETMRRVQTVRDFTGLPVIYDHQKAGNDIPEMGPDFAKVCKKSGVDAIILFPFSSPVTEINWIKSAQDAGLSVLVEGHMTVPKFLESEGGFIADSAPDRIYQIAAENGVRDFVVPGNKVPFVEHYRGLLDNLLGPDNFILYAPGFIAQGGIISEAGKAAGNKFHAIVGSAIYGKNEIRTIEQMRKAAEEVTTQIR